MTILLITTRIKYDFVIISKIDLYGSFLVKIDTMSVVNQTNIIQDWIYSRSGDMRTVEGYNEKEIVIKGYVQSGKTSFMLYTATLNLLKGVSSVIVLRNTTGDKAQIISRLRSLQEDIKVGCGVDIDLIREKDEGCPKIFVEIGNNSRLSRLNSKLKDTDIPFVLFIDEADSNDTGNNKRTDEVGIMKESAQRIFFISATILDLSMKEPEPAVEVIDLTVEDDVQVKEEVVTPQKVHMLTPPPNYMGIEKLVHRTLPEQALPCNKNDDEPFERDPNLSDFIRRFAAFEPHDLTMFETKHPQHCLISCGTVIKPQRKIFNWITRSGSDIVTILYNGDGIDLYHPSLVKKIIVLPVDGGRKVVGGRMCLWSSGAHSFDKSVGISDILGWLKRNGGVEKFPRILTISGKLAGRGISFVSDDYGEYMRTFGEVGIPKTIGWRLTGMYYIPSPMTSQPNLMQAVGRACCICRDNIQTCIYSTEEVFEDIKKSYWTQEELVARTRGTSTNMNEIQMNSSKLSKRRLTVSGVKRISKDLQVPWFEDDGGFDMSTYGDYVEDMCREKWGLSISKGTFQRPHGGSIEMDKAEYDRLVNKMFPVWAKSDSMISSFMHQIDPDKVYTKLEIQESCTFYGVRMTDIMYSKGKSNKYGSIFEKVKKDRYRMYPDLVESYKANF